MDEFALICQHFAPLSAPMAHDLKDDGATLPPLAEGQEWRVSTDTLVADVHFRRSDFLADVAYRAVATSVSDLYAQRAAPALYLLNLTAPKDTDWAEIAQGLKDAQADFGINLLGGDTTVGPVLTLSLTVFGTGQLGQNPLRSQAKGGDHIGLSLAAHGPLGASKAGFEGDEAFAQAYLRPQPRALNIHAIVHSMADVSDGVLADLGHICAASGVGARVWAHALPTAYPDHPLIPQITWGDDYALVFTAPILPPDAIPIGEVIAGQGVKLLDADGMEIAVETAGYKHL